MTPIRSTLNCSNCHGRGHTVDTCFKAGGGLEGQCDKYQANRTHAQAHLAHLDEAIANRQQVQAFLVRMEDILDGNDFVSTMTLPSLDIVVAPDPVPVVDIPDMTAFSVILFSSTDVFTPPMNDNLFFEAYPLSLSKFSSVAFSVFTSNLSSITDDLPIVLSASVFSFNSVLDSGCTHYIIHDHVLFWSYDTTLATPVKTANCGFLQTLA